MAWRGFSHILTMRFLDAEKVILRGVWSAMCLLCYQARGQQFQARQSGDGRGLHGLSIALPKLLNDGKVVESKRTVLARAQRLVCGRAQAPAAPA